MNEHKTYVTLQQRQIVVNSSIIERPEYLKLKEALERNQKIDQAVLDKDNEIDTSTKDIIVNGFDKIYDIARSEWQGISNSEYGEEKCSLCNQPNKLICFIENRINKKTMNVGSTCIKHFKNLKMKNTGESVSKLMQNMQASKRAVDLQVSFKKAYPNFDQLLQGFKMRLENAKILLPSHIYSDFTETIKECDNFKKQYLSGRLNINSLPVLKSLLQKCDYQDTIATDWINKNQGKPLICTNDMKEWLISEGKENVVEIIRSENSVLSINTLHYMAYEPFILEALPEMRKRLLDIFLSINLYEKLFYIVFNNKQLHDISFCCTPKPFMEHFANCLCNDNLKVPSMKESLSFMLLDTDTVSNPYLLMHRLKKYYSQYDFLYDDSTKQVYIISFNRHEFITVGTDKLVRFFLPRFIHENCEDYTEQYYFKQIKKWKSMTYLDDEKLKHLYEGNK